MKLTDPKYSQTQVMYQAYYTSYVIPETTVFFNSVMLVSYLSFMSLMFAFQHLFDIIYASVNKSYINPFSTFNLLNLTIFTIFLTNIAVTYGRNLDGTWLDYPLLDS
jgi:hypothetical protein